MPTRIHKVLKEDIISSPAVTVDAGTGYVGGDDGGVEGPLASLESIGNALPTSVLQTVEKYDADDDCAIISSVSDYPLGISMGQKFCEGGRSSDQRMGSTLETVEPSTTGKTGNSASPKPSTIVYVSEHQNQASAAVGVVLPPDVAEHKDGRLSKIELTSSVVTAKHVASTTTSSSAATSGGTNNSIHPSDTTNNDELPSSSSQLRPKGSSSTAATSLVLSANTPSFDTQQIDGTRQLSGASRSSGASFFKKGDEPTTAPASRESSTSSSKSSNMQNIDKNKPSIVPLSGDDYHPHNRSPAPASLSSCLTTRGRSTSGLAKIDQKDGSSKHIPAPTALRRRWHVSFSSVQIRRYPMILADNPACTCGPPLSLGWEYELLPEMSMTEFESFRLRSRRLHINHLILSHYKRVEILQRTGYSANEIKAVEKEMAKVRRQRQMTAISPFGKLELLAESARRVKLGFGRKGALKR